MKLSIILLLALIPKNSTAVYSMRDAVTDLAAAFGLIFGAESYFDSEYTCQDDYTPANFDFRQQTSYFTQCLKTAACYDDVAKIEEMQRALERIDNDYSKIYNVKFWQSRALKVDLKEFNFHEMLYWVTYYKNLPNRHKLKMNYICSRHKIHFGTFFNDMKGYFHDVFSQNRLHCDGYAERLRDNWGPCKNGKTGDKEIRELIDRYFPGRDSNKKN